MFSQKKSLSAHVCGEYESHVRSSSSVCCSASGQATISEMEGGYLERDGGAEGAGLVLENSSSWMTKCFIFRMYFFVYFLELLFSFL